MAGTSIVTTTVNDCFCPYEQFSKGSQSTPAWDIYGLSATLYFSVTGRKPQPAVDRVLYNANLEVAQLTQAKVSYELGCAIAEGLAVETQNRPSSINHWWQEVRKRRISLAGPADTKRFSSSNNRYLQDIYVWGVQIWLSIFGVLVSHAVFGYIFAFSVGDPSIFKDMSWTAVLASTLFSALIYSASSLWAKTWRYRLMRFLGFAGIFTTLFQIVGGSLFAVASCLAFIKFLSLDKFDLVIRNVVLNVSLTFSIILGFSYLLIYFGSIKDKLDVSFPVDFDYGAVRIYICEILIFAISMCWILVFVANTSRNWFVNSLQSIALSIVTFVQMIGLLLSSGFYADFENHYSPRQKLTVLWLVSSSGLTLGGLLGLWQQLSTY